MNPGRIGLICGKIVIRHFWTFMCLVRTGPSLIINTPWRQKQSVAYCEHPKVRAHAFGESVAYSNFSSTIATTTYHYQVRR